MHKVFECSWNSLETHNLLLVYGKGSTKREWIYIYIFFKEKKRMELCFFWEGREWNLSKAL